MNIDRYVSSLRDSLEVSGRAGGGAAAEAAAHLADAVEPAVRLTVQQVLIDAAAEVNGQLGSDPVVEVRLRGTEPELVVVPGTATPPRGESLVASILDRVIPPPPAPPAPPRPPGSEDVPERDDDAVARISLRMPEWLKGRVDEAAAQAGISVNTWLVRVAQLALDAGDTPHTPSSRSGKRLTGWAR
ncbi:conserved hypothetical protein [Beutenbergia cavernae DSM 12333]|uniref:HicB family protein n=1 Tax=Beutenbergia cavernae (strain ATCC BAA-8 / DSM 12333 / CCUG 43141 / JCM 11478 / NBRC 16432 / NCIMB 13614 / HKI 0122) TaxID=471853 RepID=C5C460_BEUC1|nr:toxin-antitoxin system HicB family antitoxin [Beutenbergia cavernae]ACQ79973.1 conserved hypothetical protein [Beutenbergia cavernae DSM 12333]